VAFLSKAFWIYTTTRDTTGHNGDASLFLSFLNPPEPQPLKHIQLQAGVPEWVHLPNTGKQIVWRLRIQFSDSDAVRLCISQPATYRDYGQTFTFGSGWSSVIDPVASDGKSAEAITGTRTGAFGVAFVPAPGVYDIWYRVRVAKASGTSTEMTLTLTDVTSNRYVAAKTFRPNEAGTTYSWLLVAANVSPSPGDLMRFQTNAVVGLSTNWYVDVAAMVAAGSSVPSSLALQAA
jgi:hypothetical protein